MGKKSGRDVVLELSKEAGSISLRLKELKWEQKKSWERLKEIGIEVSALTKKRGFLKVDEGLHEAGRILKLCAERGNVRVVTGVSSKGYRDTKITVLSDNKHLLRYAIGKGSVYRDVWALTGFQNVQAVVAATWQYLPESTKADAKAALKEYHDLGKGKIEVKAGYATY